MTFITILIVKIFIVYGSFLLYMYLGEGLVIQMVTLVPSLCFLFRSIYVVKLGMTVLICPLRFGSAKIY